jgi:sec-independent protein translocase protein TatA
MGPQEFLIVGIIAVLLFGKRLPEVGRSLGKSFMEFKKGLRDVQDELNVASSSSHSSGHVAYRNPIDDYQEPTAPKFEPPTEEPK